jgi:hypothetical protein
MSLRIFVALRRIAFGSLLALSPTACLAQVFAAPPGAVGEIRVFEAVADAVAVQEKPSVEDKPADKPAEGEAEEGPAPAPMTPPTDPDVVTLTLADGSKISGKLTVQEIKVTTSFGVLTVPV